MGEQGDIRRIGDLEKKYLEEVLDGQFRSQSGATYMGRLEQAFAARFGSRFAVSMVNGTATLHASLEAAGIGVGDEVIVPPLTMSATSFAVLQAGATPVFADVEPGTYQISATSIRQRISTRTKAIITVALYGLSPDMDPIMNIARECGLFVLEDNAECFLGTYKGRLAGRIGHAASYSFQSSKHLTSGEGGIVITDNEEFATKLRRISSLGYAGVGATKGKITKLEIQDPNYQRHVSMGWNYRMPELCCAVALAQVERIDELVARRQEVAALFRTALDGNDWISAQVVPDGLDHSYWTFVAELRPSTVEWHKFRDTFRKLGGDGVYAAWQLTYLEPMFLERRLLGRESLISNERLSEYKVGLCPVAESIQPRLLQFRTNYWIWDEAVRQADVLRRTIEAFV